MDEALGPENNLLDQAIRGGASLPPRVRRHLVEGYARRLLMLQASRIFIQDRIVDRTEPMDSYLATEIAVHLNAYYLNLMGALDNLAWALNELLALQLSESDGSRRRCALLDDHFLTLLEVHHSTLANELREFCSWGADVKELRDPAAHRIPLYPSPGVLPPQHRAEWNRLNEEMSNEAKAERSILPLLDRQRALATYDPLLVLSGPSGLETRNLLDQLRTDHESFLTIGLIVLPEITGSI